MAKGKRKRAYRWDQTGLIPGPKASILKTSDELDWPDVNVTLISEPAASSEQRANPDLQFTMPLNPTDITATLHGRAQRLLVPSDRLFIIAPETPWSTEWRNDVDAVCVFVRRHILTEVANELFERDVDSFEVIPKFGIEDHSLALLLHLLKEALDAPKGHSSLMVEYISRALAARVLGQHSAPLHRSSITQDQLTAKQAKLVVTYIQRHLSSKILLNDLAALAGLGRTYFLQRFSASFGVTPYRYVTNARIGLARKLLENSNLPVAHIATLCGFADSPHLIGVFKRIVGMTPAQYRLKI